MSKLPLLLILALLIATPTAAEAAGVAAAFTAVKAAFASSAVLSSIGQLALSIGASKLAQRLAARRQQTPGQQIEVQTSGETVSETFIVGRWADEGHLIYAASHGQAGRTPNAYFQQVVELSGVPVTALHGVILGDTEIEFGTAGEYGTEALNENLRDGKAHFWIKFHDGTQTEADPMLVARNADGPRPWLPTSVGTGVCYAVATWLQSRTVWQGGVQPPRYIIDGIRMYDPRLDGSVGGSGPVRLDNPATWPFTRNPVTIAYNVAIGIPLPDGNIYGGRYRQADLPLDQWASAMNDADARGWHFGAMVKVAEHEPADLIDACMAACAGQVAPVGAELHIQVGEPRQAVWSITDDDISTDDPTRFEPVKGLAARHNAIAATWISPEKQWEPMTLPLLRNPVWEAEDGGRLLPVGLNLAGVSDQDQANELQAIYIADERRQRQHQFVLPPDAARLRPLDVIEWTSASNYGAPKLFEVAATELRTDNLFCGVSLREVDPADYAPPAGSLPALSAAPPVVVLPQPVPGWHVTSAFAPDGAGAPRRPAILNSWDPDQCEDVETLQWQTRVAGTQTVIAEGVAAVADGEVRVYDGILPATAYQSRGRLIADRPTVWTDWKAATTDDIGLIEADLGADLRARIDGAFEDSALAVERIDSVIAEIFGQSGLPDLPSLPGLPLLERLDLQIGYFDVDAVPALPVIEMVQIAAASLRRTRDEINSLVGHLLEVGLIDHVERETLRREVMVELGANRASFSETIQTIVSEASALASRTTSLEAETDTLSALVEAVEIAFTSEVEALSALITALSVGSATTFDQFAIWRFDSTPEGWTGSPNAPSVVTPGFLRPGAGASSIVSSSGLAGSTTEYRQLRALLRREGSPVWVGYLWYAGAGESFSEARRIALSEPDWLGGEAQMTTNLPADLVIDRVRLDLVSDADGAAFIEADWVAIGRPSPGASSAEVKQEVAARIAQGAAQAALIAALDTRLAGAETGLDAQVLVTTAHTSQIEDLGDGLEATGARLDEIDLRLDDPDAGLSAIGQAIEELGALVQSTETGGLLILAQSLRQLRAETQLIATEALGSALQTWAAAQDSVKLVAEATQNIGSRIDANDNVVRLFAQSVTELQAAIPGLATVNALDALLTQIEVVDGRVSTEVQRTNELKSLVEDPDTGLVATGQALQQTMLRTDQTETGIEQLGQRTSSLELRADDIDAEIAVAEAAIQTLEQTRITGQQATAAAQQVVSTSLEATAGNTIGGRIENRVATRTTPAQATASAQQVVEASLAGTAGNTIGGRIQQEAQAIAAGTTVAGLHVHTDDVSQSRIVGAALAATLDPATTVRWKLADGTFITLDADTIVAVAQAVRDHVQACFDREAFLLEQINDGVTPDIDTGWPD